MGCSPQVPSLLLRPRMGRYSLSCIYKGMPHVHESVGAYLEELKKLSMRAEGKVCIGRRVCRQCRRVYSHVAGMACPCICARCAENIHGPEKMNLREPRSHKS